MSASAAREETPAGAFPGSGILHPVPIAALALLVLNDHLFKAWWPGFVTGKLSDVAGLAFFPVLLQAGWELVTRRRSSPAVLVACAVATGAVFALANATAAGDAAYRAVLGLLQWPARAAAALLAGDALPAVATVRHVADLEDLLALPVLLVHLRGGLRARPGARMPSCREAGGERRARSRREARGRSHARACAGAER